jgi:putative ATPase
MSRVTKDAFVENLSYSPGDKDRQRWISRTVSERGKLLQVLRKTLFEGLTIRRSDRVLVCNAGHGLLLWEAYRSTPEGLVVAQVRTPDQRDHINHYAQSLSDLDRPIVHCNPLDKVLDTLGDQLRFEVIVGRNLFSRAKEEEKLLAKLKARLTTDGSLHIAESVPSLGSRLSDFVAEELQQVLRKAEHTLYADASNPLTNWTAKDLLGMFEQAGLAATSFEMDLEESRSMADEDIRRYLSASYLPAFAAQGIEIDAKKLEQELINQLAGRALAWKHHLLFVHTSLNTPPTSKANTTDDTFKRVKQKVHQSK